MPAFEFVLAGRYKLVAPLGEGGMAAVYRARDLRLNRDVAVKILHEALTRDPEFLKRFEREAQVVASLSHPNIVPVYDVGEDRGTHFIVMEYVRGRTLREAIESGGKLSPERAVAVVLPILEALDYAHRQGLVHRDVKPHNMLLTPDGTPRLADFGIAHLVDGSTTRTAAILGSAQYLSPEQSRGDEATPQSDIYACGVVLYEALSGAPPFTGSNALAIAHQHLRQPPAPLDLRDAPGLESSVMKALAKEPDERYESAQAFADSLRVFEGQADRTLTQPLVTTQAAHPVAARPVGRPEDARVVVRRSTRKSAVLTAVLIIAVAVAAYAASLPFWSSRLPQYPSLPYALLPAACAAFAACTWLQSRSWVYMLDHDVAVVQWGILAHHRFGVPLRHVVTVELKQNIIDRILGVGTVEICARDQQGDERRVAMEDVPRPRKTYDDLIAMLGQGIRRPALPADEE